MGEWFSIETAPDNGEPIIVCDARTKEVRVGIRKLFFHKSGKYEWFRDESIIPGHTWGLTPTHWMPIPELPNDPDE